MTGRDLSALYQSPNALAAHYSRFAVGQRLLLTGHSHQAWPDRAREGVQRAFDDAARYVDDKWQRAFEQAERVRIGFSRLLGADPSGLCLGTSTFELLVSWLSALPLQERRCIVTSDAEFHSARRLLARLAEEGLQVVRVPARPAATVGERLAAAVDDGVAAVITSSVFYDSGELAGELGHLARRCELQGCALLIDAYHHLNVAPFSLSELGLERAFVLGGGYKYCQLGEGNAFLRAPPDCALRPAITGWYADFSTLEDPYDERVRYGGLRTRFAGATYDPTSHYRAAEVFAFFEEQGLHATLLREVSQHQVGVLCGAIDALDLPERVLSRSDARLDQRAGFLALHVPQAARIQRELAARGVHCDSRGQVLRLGPAPYLCDDQLREAVSILGEVVESTAGTEAGR